MYVVRGLLIFVIYTGFVIQQYVIVDLVWPNLKNKLGFGTDGGKLMDFAAESVFRTFLVVFERNALHLKQSDTLLYLSVTGYSCSST